LYEEVVIDDETGETIHECREPLSDHTGHGSARPRGGGVGDSVPSDGYVEGSEPEEPNG
jgi:hypothetical protein